MSLPSQDDVEILQNIRVAFREVSKTLGRIKPDASVDSRHVLDRAQAHAAGLVRLTKSANAELLNRHVGSCLSRSDILHAAIYLENPIHDALYAKIPVALEAAKQDLADAIRRQPMCNIALSYLQNEENGVTRWRLLPEARESLSEHYGALRTEQGQR